jgi:hypothetical protein
MEALHGKFIACHPEFACSIMTFRRHKPDHFQTPKPSDREQCLCLRCENLDLLVQATHAAGLIAVRDKQQLLEALVCSTDRPACLSRGCAECKDRSPILTDVASHVESVAVPFWRAKEGSSGMEKAMRTLECREAVETLQENLLSYALHFMRMMHQFRAIKELKLSLEPGHLILHVDFSENYSAKYHREVQSAHFGDRQQVTIHQGVAYVAGQESQAFATLSDDNDKKAEAIAAHLRPIFQRFNLAFGKFDRVSIVSDSPSSQYRNRKTLYIIDRVLRTELDIMRWQWIYTEAGHGKGAADGVGAAIKRRCDTRVTHGDQMEIVTADDVKAAVQAGGKSTIFVATISSADIQAIKDVFDLVRLSPMSGIARAHHAQRTAAGIIYRELACLCGSGIDFCPCHQAKVWEPLGAPHEAAEPAGGACRGRHRQRGAEAGGEAPSSHRRGRGRSQSRPSVAVETCAAANCIRPQGRRAHWVQCDGCDCWQHLQCAGFNVGDELPEHFFCSIGCLSGK